MRKPGTGASRRRGAAMIEFSFAVIFLIPLLLGTLVFGFRLIRSVEMSQITRDIGHMYLRGIDFRNPGPQANAQTLSSSFALSAGGQTRIVLSKIRIILQGDCDASNALLGIGAGRPCTNLNKSAFVEQLAMGNSTVAVSVFGTPPLKPDLTVSVANLGGNSLAQTLNFDTILLLKAGEVAYVCEMFNLTPELNIPGVSGQPQVYARTIF